MIGISSDGHCAYHSLIYGLDFLGMFSAHRVVAAGVAGEAQLLVQALIRQPLADSLPGVGCQHRLQRRHVPAHLRQRLRLANVSALRRAASAGPHNVTHSIARQLQLARDRLDLALLDEVPLRALF